MQVQINGTTHTVADKVVIAFLESAVARYILYIVENTPRKDYNGTVTIKHLKDGGYSVTRKYLRATHTRRIHKAFIDYDFGDFSKGLHVNTNI